ncbi:MAG: hypothetical protein MI867_15490 [Pseudomonadales bacterium]|nr:hypothetical protein [Pseudomonadales bacterium]
MNRYGKGDVVSMAYNPASIGNRSDAKAIMQDVVEYIRPNYPIRVPKGVKEIVSSKEAKWTRRLENTPSTEFSALIK